MGLVLFTEGHKEEIAGVISCYDRMLIQGTLPGLCYAQGMTSYLYARQIRIFDYPRFAQPWREALRENAERLAAEQGLEMEFIRRTKSFRKEDKVHQVLKQRGGHPGLVWIFSAMEACSSYQPWHDKQTHKTFIRPDSGKCLHYYFYFLDAKFGLIYLRVPPCVARQLGWPVSDSKDVRSLRVEEDGVTDAARQGLCRAAGHVVCSVATSCTLVSRLLSLVARCF